MGLVVPGFSVPFLERLPILYRFILSVLLSVGIWVVSRFWLLKIKPTWFFLYMPFDVGGFIVVFHIHFDFIFLIHSFE